MLVFSFSRPQRTVHDVSMRMDDKATLDEIVVAFESFLKASGYDFHSLAIVEKEEEEEIELDEALQQAIEDYGLDQDDDEDEELLSYE